MLRRLALALLIAAAPALALAQSRGSPRYDAITIDGAAAAGSVVTPSLTLGGFTLAGVGTAAGTLAAGNDARITGATQNTSAAITGGTINGAVIGGTTPATGTFTGLSANGLTLGAPLPLTQGGCGATSALGCLSNLGLVGSTPGQVLTSNGPGVAPTYQAAATVSNAVRYDAAQSLALTQQLQARQNIGARGAGILAKSAAYTIATTDAGRLIAASGTWALTLPSAAAVGNGFTVEVSNTGTGKITLTPNGSDTIRGQSSLVVNLREGGVLVSDGTNWQAIGFEPVVVASSVSDGSGYVRWSNGYLKQWGRATGSDVTVTFPIAYSYIPVVTASYYNANASAIYLYGINFSRIDTAGFDGRGRIASGGSIGQPGESWNWTAEGFL